MMDTAQYTEAQIEWVKLIERNNAIHDLMWSAGIGVGHPEHSTLWAEYRSNQRRVTELANSGVVFPLDTVERDPA